MKAMMIILGILLCSMALAEPQPWMKQENPESLNFDVFVNPDCPVSHREVRDIADGVLIRSRLRPGINSGSSDDFGFAISIECMNARDRKKIFTVDLRWVRFVNVRYMFEVSGGRGSFGTGDAPFIKDSIKEQVELLVTDYLQANFDLSPN